MGNQKNSGERRKEMTSLLVKKIWDETASQLIWRAIKVATKRIKKNLDEIKKGMEK